MEKCTVPGCTNDLPEGEDPDDFKCVGCGAFVCPEHFGDPWGSHNPEDHDDD